jgi:hypothetical protein
MLAGIFGSEHQVYHAGAWVDAGIGEIVGRQGESQVEECTGMGESYEVGCHNLS